MPPPSTEPPCPPAPAPPDTSAYALLDLPVAWADARGLLCGANPAFAAATGWQDDRPQTLAGLLALDTAASAPGLTAGLARGLDLAGQRFAGRDRAGAPIGGLIGQRVQGGLRVLTLQLDRPQPAAPAGDSTAPAAAAAPPAPATAPAARLAELLDLTQELGGLGVWERDLRTQTGRWEAGTWRFWGLPPAVAAPPFAHALERVHPDDRRALHRAYRDSRRNPGDHGHRFRVCGADGGLRHVRLLWRIALGADGSPAWARGIVVDDTETIRLAGSIDAAQARFDAAIALADIGVWQLDAGTALLHCNPLGWSLLGLAPAEGSLPLAALRALVHPEDLEAFQAQCRGAVSDQGRRTDGAIEFGLRLRHADGRWRSLLTRRVAQRDASGALLGHAGVVLDLSERFAQQQHALALAQRLEMATAAAGVGIWSVALDQPDEVHWDEQMRALHGLAPGAPAPLLDDYIGAQVLAADRDAVGESLATLLRRREGLLDMDLRIVRPDGQVRRLATRSSISQSAGRRQLHGVMLDVTERHATEDQLRHATERAALAARGAGIGTWESDADAALGWWDAQMFRLRGREPVPGPVALETMMAWLHPADRDKHRASMQRALDGDGATNLEFRVLLPDGSVRWLASRSSPVRDESGRTLRRIGINWDITDARNAAAARQEWLLAQRESQAKSRFLARISHELRTPLNAVLGFSQLLLADADAPDPATWRRRIEHVQASGEHLLALIDDVLELSSLESGELPRSLQPVALAPLAQTSLPLVELLAQEHGVALRLGALDGWALADPVRLRQVLVNLLSNAIKYNRRGGHVDISAVADQGWLLLRVEDSGRGLDAEQISHLFEPFNRLGLEREGIAGTGIGLAIVQASVQHMGGTVRVRSTPGVGSCFELCLQQARPPVGRAPAGDSAAPDPAGAATAAPADSATRPRLLYIEDNEVNLLIVRELVGSRSDIDFLAAEDGGSGLAAARASLPALILLDMQLPDMDGHAVLRALRADPLTAGIRCIALSANAIPEDIRRALEAGFDDYWTKPLDLGAFLRALDRLFGSAPAAAPPG